MSKIIEYITFEDFEKLYKAEKDKRVKLAILLGFGSGLRISELVGWTRRKDKTIIPALSPDMINLEAHQIKILSGKGDKWRVTITPPALTKEMIKLLPLDIKRRALQDRFSKLTMKVLGKKMHFHMLRHGFGNYTANVLKLPLPMIQQMMGHTRIDITGLYTRVNPEFAIGQAWKAMTGEK